MEAPVPNASSLTAYCKVCSAPSAIFGEGDLLKKYHVQYFRCERCGFIQTETPYWLEEAYSSAIAAQDVGIMHRNFGNCVVTCAVLNLLFPKMSKAVDFGAGHGILVRMMRDKGFNFFWSDMHATNDYARGFESKEGLSYDFLTAFEVLEHFTDPVADLSKLMNLSENVFVSTVLVPEPTPGILDWWYYLPTTGQHIAFYTTESLRILADRFGRNLLTFGPYHLFTKEPKSSLCYRLALNPGIARIVNRIYRRQSLIDSDYRQMIC